MDFNFSLVNKCKKKSTTKYKEFTQKLQNVHNECKTKFGLKKKNITKLLYTGDTKSFDVCGLCCMIIADPFNLGHGKN